MIFQMILHFGLWMKVALALEVRVKMVLFIFLLDLLPSKSQFGSEVNIDRLPTKSILLHEYMLQTGYACHIHSSQRGM